MTNDAPLTVTLLGGFHVWLNGTPVPPSAWRQRKPASLVKLLALAPAYQLHREVVCETFWPDLDPPAAANNLRGTLLRARRELSGALNTPLDDLLQRSGDLLVLGRQDRVTVDVAAFEAATANAWHSPTPECLQRAIDRYGGDLLPDEPYADWAADRRVALRNSFLTLLQRLADVHESNADYQAAVDVLERLVAEEPTGEAASVQIMRLYERLGHPERALRHYRRLSEALQRELGCPPERPAQQLANDIKRRRLTGNVPDRPSTHRATGTPVGAAHGSIWTLPAPVDTLIGREREVAEIRQLIRSARLVTLTGAGGIGKTRLAIQIAHDLTGADSGKVAFVDLSAVRDSALVLPTIAARLKITPVGAQSLAETLQDALRARTTLLVLDNVEHVIDAASDISMLLTACPGLRVLATSRVRLRLRGEVTYRVPSLPIADGSQRRSIEAISSSPAVALFIARAKQARPSYAVADTDLVSIIEICQRLDGLPLAIELAAARVRILHPTELRHRLRSERSLSVLDTGRRDGPARHQTIRETISWSYHLLSPTEQQLFRRLAVFAGGWTMAAAEAVVNADGVVGDSIMNALEALLDASLVMENAVVAGESRFGFLETIREFADELLRESPNFDTIHDAHAAYFLRLSEPARTALEGGDQETWIARLTAEHPNYRVAIAHSLTNGDYQAVLEITRSLWRFWDVHRYPEVLPWVELALDASPADDSPLRTDALLVASSMSLWRGDFERADRFNQEALQIHERLGDEIGIGKTLMLMGSRALISNHTIIAKHHYEASLSRLNITNVPWWYATVLTDLGAVFLELCEFDLAREHLQQAIAVTTALGDDKERSLILNKLVCVEWARGNYVIAHEYSTCAVALARSLRVPPLLLDFLMTAACLETSVGHFDRASTLLDEATELQASIVTAFPSVEIALRRGNIARLRGDLHQAKTAILEAILGMDRLRRHRKLLTSDVLRAIGYTFAADGNALTTVHALSLCSRIMDEMGHAWFPREVVERDTNLRNLRVILGDAAFDQAWSHGAAADPDAFLQAVLVDLTAANQPMSA